MSQNGGHARWKEGAGQALRLGAWHLAESGDVLTITENIAARTHRLDAVGNVLSIVPAADVTNPPRMVRQGDTQMIYGA